MQLNSHPNVLGYSLISEDLGNVAQGGLPGLDLSLGNPFACGLFEFGLNDLFNILVVAIVQKLFFVRDVDEH